MAWWATFPRSRFCAPASGGTIRRGTSCRVRTGRSRPCTPRQGLTLVHFSAQLEPFLTQNTPYHPLIPPDAASSSPKQPLTAPPIPQGVLTLSQEVDECKPLPRGGGDAGAEGGRGGGRRRRRRGWRRGGGGAVRYRAGAACQGRALQVDPMKPLLKPPGTKHLKSHAMICFQLSLSNSACAATPR